MALSPTSKNKTDAEGAGGEENKENAGAQPGELSQEVKDLLTSKDTEIRTLTEQLAAAQDKGTEDLEAEKQARLKDAQAKDGKIAELETALEQAKAAAAAKSDKPAKAEKPKILSVISKNDRSYLVENGIRVLPDRPVRAEWRPGNLLDANMKAGLIEEFDPNADEE